ncbi:MAG: adenylosuccinate lyase [Omnitrophica WOR_2 bacterium]
MVDFDNYSSPYSWRYASSKMRQIWSEKHKRHVWRQIWVALAEVESQYGLVSEDQLADLKAHVDQIDIPRALQIEAEIHHDLIAELKAFSEQSRAGGGVLHLGATSMDIEDNADAMRMRESLDLILPKLGELLILLSGQIERWAAYPIIAFTHLQPAEPSTLGYRLAQYAQDLFFDWQDIKENRENLRGKGFKGAVGTAAAYAELIGIENLAQFEERLSQLLALPFFPVTSQTYPRKQDYRVISSLAGMGASLYKFAFDLRFLQSPPIGEWAEPFSSKQVGSSAMPFKKNPIQAEKIDSLARYLSQLPRLAWDNEAHSLLERTLDDSANRRTLLPEAFLCSDELLNVALNLIQGIQFDQVAMKRNLATYNPFAATERVLMALVKEGADRQAMHERLREHALKAWEQVQQEMPNPLIQRVVSDALFLTYLSEDQLRTLMDASTYTGSAKERALALAAEIRAILPPEYRRRQ